MAISSPASSAAGHLRDVFVLSLKIRIHLLAAPAAGLGGGVPTLAAQSGMARSRLLIVPAAFRLLPVARALGGSLALDRWSIYGRDTPGAIALGSLPLATIASRSVHQLRVPTIRR
jgi:hypothetical protein